VGAVRAQDAYPSAFFKLNRAYAERFGDEWVILSAEYGFMRPDFMIPEPYDVSFNRKASGPISISDLREHMQELGLTEFRRVIGLGGREYRALIERAFEETPCEVIFPFAGLPGMGYMMQAVNVAMAAQEYPEMRS
jgi:hypothetical protein